MHSLLLAHSTHTVTVSWPEVVIVLAVLAFGALTLWMKDR